MKDCHINIFWSDEDDCYVADIPDLVYCSTVGPTPQAALEQLEIAKTAWLETARAEGEPIPPPSYRPLIYQLSG